MLEAKAVRVFCKAVCDRDLALVTRSVESDAPTLVAALITEATLLIKDFAVVGVVVVVTRFVTAVTLLVV